MGQYQLQFMDQLAHQLELSPDRLHVDQFNRMERLIGLIEPSRSYPPAFITFHITGYRSRQTETPTKLLPGEKLRTDLQAMIDDLSGRRPLSLEELGEPVLTLDEVARQFQVSPKTVNRWRRRGLISRRFRFGRRVRVGVLAGSLERFVARNSRLVARGGQFRKVSESERQRIFSLANRFSEETGSSLTRAARRIARILGRSPQTVRDIIVRHDEQHREDQIFPNGRKPLTPADLAAIDEAYQAGQSPNQLAAQYGRTRSSIYRILTEQRAKRILAEKIDYMYNPVFDLPYADDLILNAPSHFSDGDSSDPIHHSHRETNTDSLLQSLTDEPLLKKREEYNHFRRYNYLKFKISRLREHLLPYGVGASQLDTIDRLDHQARDLRDEIVRANVRLVISIARRHLDRNHTLFELLSDGILGLMKAVERFDYSRGYKFSTYASWAVMKGYARSVPKEHYRPERTSLSMDEAMEVVEDLRVAPSLRSPEVDAELGALLSRLPQREQQVLVDYFGLQGRESRSLSKIGQSMGLSKQRARQLKLTALARVRKWSEKSDVDFEKMLK